MGGQASALLAHNRLRGRESAAETLARAGEGWLDDSRHTIRRRCLRPTDQKPPLFLFLSDRLIPCPIDAASSNPYSVKYRHGIVSFPFQAVAGGHGKGRFSIFIFLPALFVSVCGQDGNDVRGIVGIVRGRLLGPLHIQFASRLGSTWTGSRGCGGPRVVETLADEDGCVCVCAQTRVLFGLWAPARNAIRSRVRGCWTLMHDAALHRIGPSAAIAQPLRELLARRFESKGDATGGCSDLCSKWGWRCRTHSGCVNWQRSRKGNTGLFSASSGWMRSDVAQCSPDGTPTRGCRTNALCGPGLARNDGGTPELPTLPGVPGSQIGSRLYLLPQRPCTFASAATASSCVARARLPMSRHQTARRQVLSAAAVA